MLLFHTETVYPSECADFNFLHCTGKLTDRQTDR